MVILKFQTQPMYDKKLCNSDIHFYNINKGVKMFIRTHNQSDGHHQYTSQMDVTNTPVRWTSPIQSLKLITSQMDITNNQSDRHH